MTQTKVILSDFLCGQLQEVLNDVEFGRLDVQMAYSDATARELVSDESGKFGADLIRFPAGGIVQMHKHLGSHILVVIGGKGLLFCESGPMELSPGTVYLVPENVSHEIQATDVPLTLISVGNNRYPPESPERLSLDSMS